MLTNPSTPSNVHSFEKKENAKLAAELIIANEELLFLNKEKDKRVAELVIANEEKAHRAAELVIAKEAAESALAAKTQFFLSKISDRKSVV